MGKFRRYSLWYSPFVHGQTDNLRQLFELLLGAEERYRTAYATVYHATNGTLSAEADRRFMEHARRKGMVYYFGTLTSEEGSEHRRYEDSEEVLRLWHERPHRWRQEARSKRNLAVGEASNFSRPTADPEIAYQVADGGGRWWLYYPKGMVENFSYDFGKKRRKPELAYLLEPSEIYTDLLDTELEFLGNATRAGRETIEVKARTVSLDHPPWKRPFEAGVDSHLISVDAEMGIILLFSAQMDGQCVSFTAVEEVSFDNEFLEGTFQLDLPGHSV